MNGLQSLFGNAEVDGKSYFDVAKFLKSFGWFSSGLEIATDTVANATNIFSLVTKNSSLVAKLATRFLYDLDLN